MQSSVASLEARPPDATGPAVALAGLDQIEARRVGAALARAGVAVGCETESGMPDAVIVDLCADDRAPERAVAEVRARWPDVAIVAIVSERRRRQAKDALRAGAAGIVFDTEVERTLGVAVLSASAGMISMPVELGPGTSGAPLSSREKQVLGMVVMGFTNAEIGGRLYLSESTIKSHLSSAFTKLGVHSRSEAAALILDPSEGLGVGILTLPTD
jgi:DNA-binding NarL/FixJ family response regulator